VKGGAHVLGKDKQTFQPGIDNLGVGIGNSALDYD
jgi:hypothetical protein